MILSILIENKIGIENVKNLNWKIKLFVGVVDGATVGVLIFLLVKVLQWLVRLGHPFTL